MIHMGFIYSEVDNGSEVIISMERKNTYLNYVKVYTMINICFSEADPLFSKIYGERKEQQILKGH